MEHLNRPKNAGTLESPDFVGKSSLRRGRAPRTEIHINVANGIVTQATFQTFGCGFMIATCSVLTEMMTGRSVEDCLSITDQQVSEMLGGIPSHKMFCAELSVKAMRNGLNQYDPKKHPPHLFSS